MSIVEEIDRVIITAQEILADRPDAAEHIQSVLGKMGELRANFIVRETENTLRIQERLKPVGTASAELVDQLRLFELCGPSPLRRAAQEAHTELSGTLESFIGQSAEQIEGSFRYQAIQDIFKLFDRALKPLGANDARTTNERSLAFRREVRARIEGETARVNELEDKASGYNRALINILNLVPADRRVTLSVAHDNFRANVVEPLTAAVVQADNLAFSNLRSQLTLLNAKLVQDITEIEDFLTALKAISAILGIFDSVLALAM